MTGRRRAFTQRGENLDLLLTRAGWLPAGDFMTSTTSGSAAARRLNLTAADGPELLGDKLRIPRLSLAILRRRRLIDLIDQATSHRVTVVSGPAGGGEAVASGALGSATRAAARRGRRTRDCWCR